ncbi:MAG: polyprenyl synthetase family protein [Candidatus Omnitrophica bacterium]|nr:polyprenyl synthetase family protein [Candidatus Omnitrophota bacterium]
MNLKDIYKPVQREMFAVERTIGEKISSSGNGTVVKVGGYLLRSGGKRLRPALVTLSAGAVTAKNPASVSKKIIKAAAAIELVHMASLIHDDVVDHSSIRHNKPTINAKWGAELALVLGDYLYAIGFDLMASCDNSGVLEALSQASRMMCEGELVQVAERDNLGLLKEQYIKIVKNKTANLFAASCQAGVMAAGRMSKEKGMLKDYGLNLGIAFQIADDSMDIIGTFKELGKLPGADFKMGELTLPFLNLISLLRDKKKIYKLLAQKDSLAAFGEIRRIFITSGALDKTREDVAYYADKAKNSLRGLKNSACKTSLSALADRMVQRIKV